MKIRLGFISNSSTSSYLLAFPKGMKDDEIRKAKLRISNPPGEKLAEETGYAHSENFKQAIIDYVKELKIVKQTEYETVFEVYIPIEILRTSEEFRSVVGYDHSEKEFEDEFGHYSFKNRDYGYLEVSNESGNILNELIYFLGFSEMYFEIHPKIEAWSLY